MHTQLQKTIGLSAALSTVVGMVIGREFFLSHKQYTLQLMELQV